MSKTIYKKDGEWYICIYSIQPIEFVSKLKQEGVIFGDKNAIINRLKSEDMEDFVTSYQYLADKMNEKQGSSYNALPIWFWFRFSRKSFRPDMRHCKTYVLRGHDAYLIEAELPLKQVTLTDYVDWHCVLNNWYCAKNDESKYDDFDNRLEKALKTKEIHKFQFDDYPEEFKEEISSSWDQIFTNINTDEYQGLSQKAIKDKLTEYLDSQENYSLQATAFMLKLENVVNITQYHRK